MRYNPEWWRFHVDFEVRHPDIIAAMEITQATSSVSVELIPASPEQKPILANLLELYAHDFSEFIDLRLGADGRFGYEPLPLYWTEPNRYPFLIMIDDHWAGFVLARGGSQISGDENVWDMAEFFIARGYRRLGVGTEVAHDIWRRFPGKWEVRVRDRNHHIVLLGDSIFDNGAYVDGGIDVVNHLRKVIPSDWKASLRAVDGSLV